MSASIKGGADFQRILAGLPADLETKILRGAMRAAAEVIADDARERCRSEEVKASIVTSTRSEQGLITAKIQTKGPGAYIAPWLEFGTDPHFISVDASQSGGRTIKRINREVKRGSLVIGGQFVGETVHHPGARANPFMRPALDNKQDAAIAAAGSYISTRLTKEGLSGPDVPQDPE